MKTITGIIIARNDEQMIGDALKSLSFCSDVIVIDNGSKDRTKEVAQQHEAKIYEIDSNDFSEIRNYGLAKASSDYVLYLDTDERVDEDLRENIKKILTKDFEFSAYRLKRKNYYYGKHEWPYIERIERLFVRKDLEGWKGKLHESPVIKGKLGELDGFIIHFTHRDLTSMLNKTIEWSDKEALLRFNAHHPPMSWWRFPRVMLSAFLDSYVKQQGFRAGVIGIIESIYQAFSMFITYAKLWELQKYHQKKHEKAL